MSAIQRGNGAVEISFESRMARVSFIWENQSSLSEYYLIVSGFRFISVACRRFFLHKSIKNDFMLDGKLLDSG